ncbi:MAG: hypothetical protein LC804_11545 [Acidobacteria bacterium]|nr:hypothetical protein [Acidobacteriota bacterium]
MLPDLSVVWVIASVLLLAIIMDRVLFRPLTRVMEQREHASRAARELAQAAADRARSAAAEFDQRTATARGDVYRQMDEMRRAALDQRTEILAQTRAEVEAAVADASARVRREVDEARTRLRRDADALGGAAAERILGRRVS